jgi:error-prone DNA polymerase
VAQINRSPGPIFDGLRDDAESPLTRMTAPEKTYADYEATALTVGAHFMSYHRANLKAQGVLSTRELRTCAEGALIKTAGSVIVRQHPMTAKGFVFLTLEDEFGMVQGIVSPQLFHRDRTVIVGSGALIMEGHLQKSEGQYSVRVKNFSPLSAPALSSHDFF